MKKDFGFTKDKQKVTNYKIENDKISVTVMDYGATITSVKVFDKNGKQTNVVLSFDNVSGYECSSGYIGATIGRVSNRIAGGEFCLDSVKYSLEKNNGNNTLHGGKKGFDKYMFTIVKHEKDNIVLHRLSKDGEENFPGNLDLYVELLLNNEDLIIKYKATTDKPTICDFTNHSYFNLSGDFSKQNTINDDFLLINSEITTEIDEELLPKEVYYDVAGTALDFRFGKRIGDDINNTSNKQILYAGGFDHNYCFGAKGKLKSCVKAHNHLTGITMELFTDKPGVQFYSGNFLNKDKYPFFRSAYCLETQCYPNTCNMKNFGNIYLSPGKEYNSKTIYRFGKIK